MAYVGVLLFVVLVAGCAATKVWYKPGMDELAYKQDRFRCMQATGYTELSPGQQMAAAGLAGAAAAQNPGLAQLQGQNTANRANMFTACMEALGYQLLPEDEVTAPKKK